jgi:hypothetical protein
MGCGPRGDQLGDRLVEPDLPTAGHLGQQGGGEYLGYRPDLEHGVGVRRAEGARGCLPVREPEALVADEQPTTRPAIEQDYHDLKEVDRIGQVQLRRVGSNVGALNLSMWVHARTEVWARGAGRGVIRRPERSALGRRRSTVVTCGPASVASAGDAGGGRSAPRRADALGGEYVTCWTAWSG